MARDRHQPTHELVCLQAAIQWGAGDRLAEVAARARALAGELDLPLAETVAAHAESLNNGDGEGLLAAAEAYQAIGDRCTAADAAAQAAVMLTGAQLRNRGLSAASIAAQLAAECGGLCTPATRSPVSPTPLTGRQREVAELVAAGLSNKEIADRLVTSVRTVEGHLYRACQRVGATSRAHLAAIMRAGSARKTDAAAALLLLDDPGRRLRTLLVAGPGRRVEVHEHRVVTRLVGQPAPSPWR